MRIVFNYYKTLSSVNIPLSFLLGFLFGIPAFVISFCVFGLILSAFYFELFYKQQYYFYYNYGFTKFKLIGFSFVGNILVVFLIIIILKIIHL
ncbi:hypothetical protein ACPPVU_14670 [Mucilaginibacter sp. McL0603]|uniref:hypothetical protein n=1 Tax=Mucilaginibacter sp. McL0603 TaxID=3415670 RepID=UPI003CE76DBF